MAGAFMPFQPPRGWCFIPTSQRQFQGSGNLPGVLITTQVWPVTSASEPEVCVLTRALGGSESHWHLRGLPGRKATLASSLAPPPQALGSGPPHRGRVVDAGGMESGARQLLRPDQLGSAPREPPLQSEGLENRVTP